MGRFTERDHMPTFQKSQPEKPEKDGDGDGLVHDGTPQERPVGQAAGRKGKPSSFGRKDLPQRDDRVGGIGERAAKWLLGTEKDKEQIESTAVASIAKHKAVLRDALNQLPPGMVDIAAMNIKKVVLHENMGALNTELEKRIGEQPGVAFGFYTGKGELHVDGPIPEGMASILNNSKGLDPALHQRSVYVHELAHAADVLEDGTVFSSSQSWTSAWGREINHEEAPLSRYARFNSSEGFAEFLRYYTEDPADARLSFPESVKAVEAVYGRL
jgi:hypothetical protein